MGEVGLAPLPLRHDRLPASFQQDFHMGETGEHQGMEVGVGKAGEEGEDQVLASRG